MQPNNPYQQPQVPSDYLDQIAAPAQVKTMNPMLLWAIIGGVLLLAILVVLGISSMRSGPSASSLISVGSKIETLKTVSDDGQDNIQSSDLRTLNGTLTLLLTNTSRDLTEPLKSQGINLKDKKNSSIVAVTKDSDALKSRLEDARLNAVFDRTYAREMLFELRTLKGDMAVLYKKSNGDLKTTLEKADANITPIIEELSGFNAS